MTPKKNKGLIKILKLKVKRVI